MKPEFCTPGSWCWEKGREAKRTSRKLTRYLRADGRKIKIETFDLKTVRPSS